MSSHVNNPTSISNIIFGILQLFVQHKLSHSSFCNLVISLATYFPSLQLYQQQVYRSNECVLFRIYKLRKTILQPFSNPRLWYHGKATLP